MSQVLSVPNNFFQRASLRPDVRGSQQIVRQRPRRQFVRQESRRGFGFVSQGDLQVAENMEELGMFQGLQRAINQLAAHKGLDKRIRPDGVIGPQTLALFEEAGGGTSEGTRTLARGARKTAEAIGRVTGVPPFFGPDPSQASQIVLDRIRGKKSGGGGGTETSADTAGGASSFPWGWAIVGGLVVAGLALAWVTPSKPAPER